MRDKGSLLIILIAVSLLGLTCFISAYFSIPFGQLSRDPLSAPGENPVNGMLSNIGAVFWSLAVGICFFAYSVLFGRANREELNFILYSGLFTLLLLIDDLMMVHDKMVPYFLGLDELYIYILYGFLAMIYLIWFRKFLLRKYFIFLFVAFGLFGISILTDKLEHLIDKNFLYLIEDGTKFIGISFWLTFHYLFAKSMIMKYAISKK